MGLGAGPRGYGDWQRIVNWDGPLIVNVSELVKAKAFLSPVIEVSRFGYLAGQIAAAGETTRVVITFFADVAGTQEVGKREWFMDPNQLAPIRVRIPIMGPFIQIAITPRNANANGEYTALLFPTNRYDAREFIPAFMYLINEAPKVPAAPAEVFSHPLGYWSGPTRFLVNAAEGVTATFTIESLAGFAAWTPLDRFTAAGAALVPYTAITPVGAWRVRMEPSAEATLGIRAQPCQTGSS